VGTTYCELRGVVTKQEVSLEVDVAIGGVQTKAIVVAHKAIRHIPVGALSQSKK
jgi:hypothetical protein